MFLNITLFLALVTSSFANEQGRRSDKHGEFFAAPSFVFQTYQFPGDEDGKTRLEIKVGLVNDVIQFVQLNDDRYRAAYELPLDIV
ncbi:MAG: hypothetical protein DWQ10_18830, partial [Calditrichaeota bacterium]